jgi:hypothetical protein
MVSTNYSRFVIRVITFKEMCSTRVQLCKTARSMPSKTALFLHRIIRELIPLRNYGNVAKFSKAILMLVIISFSTDFRTVEEDGTSAGQLYFGIDSALIRKQLMETRCQIQLSIITASLESAKDTMAINGVWSN